jgi:hypothetical protein
MIKVISLVIFLHLYILANVFETDNYENKNFLDIKEKLEQY